MADKSVSFMRSLCMGEIEEDVLFPYPELEEAQKETLRSVSDALRDMLEPHEKDFRHWDRKGEFPPGHSIVPNLRMWQVAEREGRADAPQYLDAALAQAQWIVDNLDVSDPATTKGQRQAEYQLMTALATLALTVPAESVPAGLGAFAPGFDEQAPRDDVAER